MKILLKYTKTQTVFFFLLTYSTKLVLSNSLWILFKCKQRENRLRKFLMKHFNGFITNFIPLILSSSLGQIHSLTNQIDSIKSQIKI